MCYASHLTNVVTDKVVCRAYFAPERLLFFAELEASAWSIQKVYVFKLSLGMLDGVAAMTKFCNLISSEPDISEAQF